MRYLMLVCWDPSVQLTPEEDEAMGTAGGAWAEEMDTRGLRIEGSQLRPPSDATTVRVQNGETLVGDGPFAETKEFIAGYDLLECASMDEAVQVAAQHPVARYGAIEVRALWEDGQ
jgi:hypothetical protein